MEETEARRSQNIAFDKLRNIQRLKELDVCEMTGAEHRMDDGKCLDCPLDIEYTDGNK